MRDAVRTYGWVPNALSVARILLVAANYVVVHYRHLPLFVTVLLLAVITDMLDGPIARRLKIADRAGANLDSASDFFFYLSLPIWAYVWRPGDIRAHAGIILAYAAVYLAVLVVLHYRRGLIGFHNRWSRAAGTAGVFYALYVIIWGWDEPVFYAMLVIVSIDLAQRVAYSIKPTAGPPPVRRPPLG
jgi:CDP-diacylglycerol--glycerol-3-phosphate 3-phosphatidyltransferase